MSRLTERSKDDRKKALCMTNAKCAIQCGECEHMDRMMEKLADYEDKQEQGLLIELPVAEGTEVYKVEEDKMAATIETIEYQGHKYQRRIPCYFICRDLFSLSMLNEVGKTVFLTLSEAREAEEALAKMGE